jgi:hypothetical protein
MAEPKYQREPKYQQIAEVAAGGRITVTSVPALRCSRRVRPWLTHSGSRKGMLW